MRLTGQQIKQFDEITKPVIQWLNNNTHPHVKVIIDNTSAELTEGLTATKHDEFIKD